MKGEGQGRDRTYPAKLQLVLGSMVGLVEVLAISGGSLFLVPLPWSLAKSHLGWHNILNSVVVTEFSVLKFSSFVSKLSLPVSLHNVYTASLSSCHVPYWCPISNTPPWTGHDLVIAKKRNNVEKKNHLPRHMIKKIME